MPERWCPTRTTWKFNSAAERRVWSLNGLRCWPSTGGDHSTATRCSYSVNARSIRIMMYSGDEFRRCPQSPNVDRRRRRRWRLSRFYGVAKDGNSIRSVGPVGRRAPDKGCYVCRDWLKKSGCGVAERCRAINAISFRSASLNGFQTISRNYRLR